MGIATISVGIDLSLTSTGLLVLCGPGSDYRSGTGPQVLRQARILTKEMRGYPRIHLISRTVLELHQWLRERALRPTVYVFEGPAFSSKLASTLGLLHGVVKMDLLRLPDAGTFSVLDVWPSTLKKFTTGKGAGDKDVMMKWVHKRWGFDSDFNDENDAYACSMVGICLYGATSPQSHRRMLEGKVEVHARPSEEDRGAASVIFTDEANAGATVAQLAAAAAPRPVAGHFRRRRVV